MSKTEPWWKSAVLYQIYPRSFADSTGSGTGDLAGITARLSYLAELGIDAIWISPFFLSPMKDFGYDVANHRRVDPLFGSNDDFEILLKKAHSLGIRVLIDLVLSHCSDKHPWFQDCLKGKGSPYDDAFIWVDPGPNGEPPNNWISIFGGPAWTFHAGRGQYYLHNFLVSQPDLNFHAPKVREEALSLARFWLDKGVDGFRLDAINFCLHDPELRDNPLAQNPDGQSVQLSNPYGTLLHLYDKNHPGVPHFLEELREVMDEYEDRVTLGEIGASQDVSQALMGEYTAPGRLNLCYSFDFLTPSFDAGHFRDLITRLGVADSNFWGCWAFSNHDVVRAASRLGGGMAPPDAIARISMALLLSFRGTPCMYQGEELGLEETDVPFERMVDPYGIAFYPEFKGRDGCRTPMPWTDALHGGFCPDDVTPWLPIPDHHRDNAVSRALSDPSHPIHGVRELLAFRKAHPALATGKLNLLDSDSRILAFERVTDTARFECVFNLSSERIEQPESANWDPVEGVHYGVTPPTMESPLSLGPWAWYIRSTGTREDSSF